MEAQEQNSSTEQNLDNNQASEGASDVSVPSTNTAQTASTKAGKNVEQGGQDWSTKYTTLEKSYNELRKKLSEQGAERNEYRKQFEALTTQQKQILEALAKATERPYDPDQFMEEFKTQGPTYLQKLVEEKLNKEKQTFQEELGGLKEELEALQIERAVEARKQNKEKYPNFAELESEMAAIFNANANFYLQLPLNDRVDALYNQAVLRHSQEALKVAGELGKKQAQAELANEAKSGVAGGGKATGSSAADFSKMSASDMRKHFVSQIGEAQD